MTTAEIKRTKLYRTLAPCIVKKDREELARMLAMVPESAIDYRYVGFGSDTLHAAFNWCDTPQGIWYWSLLCSRLRNAGHACW